MNPLLLITTVLLALVLAACQPVAPPKANHAEVAPDFALVDQDSRPARLADLRGKVVLMDFIYTSCTTACPALQAIMENVRRNLGDAFPGEVNLVTVTFDPEYDTPQVLKRYAAGAGWDLPGWRFLAGVREEVERANAAYGSIYQRVGEETAEHAHERAFVHNTLIVLIDQQGTIRQRYRGPDLGASPKILEEVRALLK